jgi:hypothetical protein
MLRENEISPFEIWKFHQRKILVEVENYFSTVNIENLRSLILFQSILQILPLTFNRHIGNTPTGTVGKKST